MNILAPTTGCASCFARRRCLGRARCRLLIAAFACLLVMLGITVPGCVPSQANERIEPFATEEVESCLTIIIDMSGSFANSWDDRAYDLFLELMDRFFNERAGSESRIVIGQLSGSEQVVLFEGRPGDLRSEFQSPEEFNAFLAERSDPNSSPVFCSTERAIEYVTSMPRVTSNTRLLTVFLSDMVDNEPDEQAKQAAGRGMLEALTEYQVMGGGIALYFVAEEETTRWRRILDKAGFEAGRYVIESTVVAKPALPRFD